MEKIFGVLKFEFVLVFSVLLLNFFFLFNPFFFFDKVSFLLGVLVMLVFLILLVCLSMVYIYYFNSLMVSFFFIFVMAILFTSFFVFDLLLFYIMFELSVIPIFLYIVVWGGSNMSVFAGLYLFFFTFFSSLLFLLGVMLVWEYVGSLSFLVLFFFSWSFYLTNFVYVMMIVFFVKMPIFFFHIWLPLAHVESPMAGSMVLASIMLKLGGYGIFRVVEFFFFSCFSGKSFFFVWGFLGALYMGITCFSQVDLKKTIAYSSVSHMSSVMMALYSMSLSGKWCFLAMMLSHGILSSFMFYGLGVIYYRFFTRNIFSLSSVVLLLPMFGMWWFFVGIMNLGFPPFISFFSEFFVFYSMIMVDSVYAFLGILLLMVSSIYTVNMMLYVISGLSKKLFFVFDIYLIEHLVFFYHVFFLVFSVFIYWML